MGGASHSQKMGGDSHPTKKFNEKKLGVEDSNQKEIGVGDGKYERIVG